MKKKDLLYLLKNVDDDTDIAINIFDKGKCSDCSHILSGNAEIIGINKASIGRDVVELDIKI